MFSLLLCDYEVSRFVLLANYEILPYLMYYSNIQHRLSYPSTICYILRCQVAWFLQWQLWHVYFIFQEEKSITKTMSEKKDLHKKTVDVSNIHGKVGASVSYDANIENSRYKMQGKVSASVSLHANIENGLNTTLIFRYMKYMIKPQNLLEFVFKMSVGGQSSSAPCVHARCITYEWSAVYSSTSASPFFSLWHYKIVYQPRM